MNPIMAFENSASNEKQNEENVKEKPIIVKSKASDKYIHLDPIPVFKDRSEIKPWLQKIFYPQGVELVIERSDNIKVVFKCKAAKRGKNSQSQVPELLPEIKNEGSQDSGNGLMKKKKRSVSRFNTCPFRIRATYSMKREKWGVVIVNNNHTHKVEFNPGSDEYKKFKEKLRIDNDIQAIKKFDELEYRFQSNLPINPTLVPCDCGLTSEIKSFNVIIPTNSTTTTVFSQGTFSPSQSANFDKSSNNFNPMIFCPSSATNITKPKKLKNRKTSSLNINQELLLKKSTNPNFHINRPHTHIHTDSPDSFTTKNSNFNTPILEKQSSHDSLHTTMTHDSSTYSVLHQHSHSHVTDHHHNATIFNEPSTFLDEVNEMTLPIGIMSNFSTDLNEIDFTESFNKPIYQKHHNHNDNAIKDMFIKDEPIDLNSQTVLFSPMTSQHSVSHIQGSATHDAVLLEEQGFFSMNEHSSSIGNNNSHTDSTAKAINAKKELYNDLFYDGNDIVNNIMNNLNDPTAVNNISFPTNSTLTELDTATSGNTNATQVNTQEEDKNKILNELTKMDDVASEVFATKENHSYAPTPIDFTNSFPPIHRDHSTPGTKKNNIEDSNTIDANQPVFNGTQISDQIITLIENEHDPLPQSDLGLNFDIPTHINEPLEITSKINFTPSPLPWDNSFNEFTKQ